VFASQKITMPVQVNGKLICTIEISKDTTQDQAIEIASQNERFAKTIQDKAFVKIIFVPSKILSIILN
jgi:leucyl-tRNA synthetase